MTTTIQHREGRSGPLAESTPLVVKAEDVVLSSDDDQRRPIEAPARWCRGKGSSVGLLDPGDCGLVHVRECLVDLFAGTARCLGRHDDSALLVDLRADQAVLANKH